MATYPEKVNELISDLRHCCKSFDGRVGSVSSSLICGSFVRFELKIDNQNQTVELANFQTNGCGYAIGSAEILCRQVTGKKLADLGGLDRSELMENVLTQLEAVSPDRNHCLVMPFEAVEGAFAEYRSSRLLTFNGDEALICTCFGVTETEIEKVIATKDLTTVDEVSAVSRAGSGCGSCRMLIQEILDFHIQ